MFSGQADTTTFLSSIRARLTLWGMLFSLSVCAIVCLILYMGLSYSLHHEVDSFLEGEVHEFCAILKEDQDDELGEIEREIRLELSSRPRGDLNFRLLDAQGRLVVTSNQNDRLPDPWSFPMPPQDQVGVSFFKTIEIAGIDVPVRVCSQWTLFPDGSQHLAQATYLLDRVVASMSEFRRICLVTILFAGVLSFIGGRLLARRSLQPVHQMTETARQISASHLSERLSRSGNGDELDKLAETLNDMLTRIEQHVHRMQQFTADAAHELRTPLAALRGNSEVALSSDRDEKALRHVIEENIQQYDHLARITDDLLLLARLDAGEAILRREPIQLDQSIADVIDLFAPLAQDHGVQLAFSECEPMVVPADEDRLRQTMSNLIDNAIKYMNNHGQIDVSLKRTDHSATIRVADTGPGIPADDLQHVFERFYRVDRARSRSRNHGTGLGLPICRSIVRAHGGEIKIESRPGMGTTVSVSLPVEVGQSDKPDRGL
ncbi:MAG: heavy metal sensor histidine kinase [Phycisphaerae bacterium]